MEQEQADRVVYAGSYTHLLRYVSNQFACAVLTCGSLLLCKAPSHKGLLQRISPYHGAHVDQAARTEGLQPLGTAVCHAQDRKYYIVEVRVLVLACAS